MIPKYKILQWLTFFTLPLTILIGANYSARLIHTCSQAHLCISPPYVYVCLLLTLPSISSLSLEIQPAYHSLTQRLPLS